MHRGRVAQVVQPWLVAGAALALHARDGAQAPKRPFERRSTHALAVAKAKEWRRRSVPVTVIALAALLA